MTNITEALINCVIVIIVSLLVGKIEERGYRKGYQDGEAGRSPRKKIGFNTNPSQDDDKQSKRK